MNLTPVSSSNIEAIGFDAAEKVLYVRFKSGPDVLRYAGVSEETHKQLISAKSIGAYFYQHIRPLKFERIKKGEKQSDA